jgi:mannan endo-1,4-beta-mannosidase
LAVAVWLGACACPNAPDDDARWPALCLTDSAGCAGCDAPSAPSPVGASFVTRAGNRLMLDGRPFRFAGANIYWLGLDEYRGIAPTTPFRQDDGLETAWQLGATVVRSHSLGISTGNSLSYEPTLGVFSEDALGAADRAVRRSGELGLRLIIPLTDNYHYYHGGRFDFVGWRGLSQGDAFYTDKTVIADFEDYVSHLLNHVNRETGVAYKDDPTILAWELGNELTADGGAAVLTPWTAEISTFIKTLDVNHLVADPSAFGTHDANAIALQSVDLYTSHFYDCGVNGREVADAARAVSAAGKVFYIGEYDWTQSTPSHLEELLASIEANGDLAGDLYWSLWSHADDFGYATGDIYSLHAPGENGGRQQRVASLRRHAFAMSGLATPAWPAPPEPVLRLAAPESVGATLAWRGSAGAIVYTVESAPSAQGPWRIVCTACVSDLELPWSAPPVDAWVRITPVNCGGAPGTPSEPSLIRP